MFLRLALFYLSFFLFFQVFAQSNPATNLLFIGNSLTYTNDLPSLVKNLQKQKVLL